ncbi:hypothetical protein [Chenggangzhangella methanolivorans]|nr:hypothetical protein [Chenggangzhangella methanolivorans]
MAVGDAAQAYDPLSSQGVDKALKSASDAGHLIHYALEDSSQGEDCSQGAAELDARNPYVVRHDEAQRRMWDEYLRRRAFYYGAVRRWPGEAFWRRRLPVEQAAADADEHRLRASPSV